MHFAKKINALLEGHFTPNEFIGKRLSYPALSAALNRALKPMRIKVRVVKSPDVTHCERVRQYFDVSGDFEKTGRRVKVVLTIRVSERREYLHMTKATYNRLTFWVSLYAQHELIHKNQLMKNPEHTYRPLPVKYSSRIGKTRVARINYLRDWYEIDAFAHDLANEIRYHYPDYDPLRILRHVEKYPKLFSFREYRDAFHGTEWDRIRKLLLLRTTKWLPTVTPIKKI